MIRNLSFLCLRFSPSPFLRFLLSWKHAHLADVEPLARLVASGFEFLDQLTHGGNCPFEYGNSAP